jgi:hypothetical protein
MASETLEPDEGFILSASSLAGVVFDSERTTISVIHLFRSFAGIFTIFFEMCWRWDFGSLYLNPVVWLINMAMLSTFSYLGLAARVFKGSFHLQGAIGMEIICVLFYVLSAIHAKRIWYLVEHPKEEYDSDLDGSPWWFIEWLPRGQEWRRARVIYEPVITLLVGIAFYFLHVFNVTALIYFVVGAIALAVKSFLTWCLSWYTIRRGLDNEYRSKVLASMRRGATPPKMIGHLPVPPQINPYKPNQGGHFGAPVV